MALARLCLNRALAGRAPAFTAAGSHVALDLRSLLSTDAVAGAPSPGEPAAGRDVAVPDRRRGGGRWDWRDFRDFSPFRLVDGLGSALSQAAGTLERFAAAAARRPSGKVREEEQQYRLRLEVPGLGKEDVRVAVEDGVLVVAVEDGVLVIQGEKREARDGGGGNGGGKLGDMLPSAVYHASLLLPEDAREEGVAAEVKDGVLYVTVPRAPERRRSATEVKV